MSEEARREVGPYPGWILGVATKMHPGLGVGEISWRGKPSGIQERGSIAREQGSAKYQIVALCGWKNVVMIFARQRDDAASVVAHRDPSS